MTLKPGTRLYCATSTSEFIVVRSGSEASEVTIGGRSPAQDAHPADVLDAVSGHDGGAELGKRYTDAAGSIELLCTKPGTGVPAVDGTLMILKQAKALPASD